MKQQKPKELVEERDEIVRLITLCNDGNVNITEEKYSNVKNYLTQQRTELLDSVSQLVKNLIKGRQLWLEDGSLATDFGVIPELRQYNQAIVDVLSILNLLNKKDESIR